MNAPDVRDRQPVRVSVVIKALNEQAHIARAVESALFGLRAVGGEVVLADACSSDHTVDIASRYPIRVVQLAHAHERSCGAGPQLGYQHSRGEYIYLMDGDMELQPGFLEQALAFLAQHPEVAGVGGHVVERNLASLEFRERAERQRHEAHRAPGAVDRLDGGGLYRRLAIQEAGYLSDRNLHSYEELELAMRLRSLGWKLWRLPLEAVAHSGHTTPPYQLLRRRWRSGYIRGSGELLRSALGQPWLPLVWRDQRELRLYLGVLLWWALLLVVALWPMAPATRSLALAALLAGPVVLMSARKQSLRRGLYAVVSWCFHAAGLVAGLLHPRTPAAAPIASRVLREPGGPAGHLPDPPGSAVHRAPLPPEPPSSRR